MLPVDAGAVEEDTTVARVVGVSLGEEAVGTTAAGVVDVGSSVVWGVDDALVLGSWMKTAPGVLVADSELAGLVATGATTVAGALVLEGVASGMLVLETTTGVPLIVVVPIATGRPVS